MTMKKIALLIAGLAVAASSTAAQAGAVTVGSTFQFASPPIVKVAAGCTWRADATRLRALRTGNEKLDFVDWVSQSHDPKRKCTVFNGSPDTWWIVTDRADVGDPTAAWYCLRDREDPAASCFWIWMNNWQR
jgi:hypothetical protein